MKLSRSAFYRTAGAKRERLDGHGRNHKRVWRIYRAMGLNLPRRKKRRLQTVYEQQYFMKQESV